jgi:hypothetical protein
MDCPKCHEYLSGGTENLIDHLLNCGYTLKHLYDIMTLTGLLSRKEIDDYVRSHNTRI